MEKIKFNFGLNNSPFTEKETINIYLTTLKSSGISVKESYISTREYNGEPEKTLVVSGEVESLQSIGGKRYLTKTIQSLCVVCTQECIHFNTETGGALVYSPMYKGEKFTFNKEFFI